MTAIAKSAKRHPAGRKFCGWEEPVIWDHTGPYWVIRQTIWGHTEPFCAIWTMQDQTGPHWTILDHTGPTICDNAGQYGTILNHTGSYRKKRD